MITKSIFREQIFSLSKRIPTYISLALFLILSLSAQAQVEIKGLVIDHRTKEPAIGASVVLKSTTNGVATDLDGSFSLRVNKKLPVNLVVSLLGYNTQEVNVQNLDEPLVIALSEKENHLDEVVVVGYGTQNKSEFTGAVSRITANEIKDVPVQSFDQALSGKAAGVSISIPNGVLNNPPVIRIRGVNSISLSSYPLVVIDGIPVNTGDISTNVNVPNNPLGDINPSDIESIDVLKDAASSSIYGSRAAAGVIIVTTKKGKTGKAKTTYDGWVGITKANRLPKVLNAQQYMDIKNEAVLNSKILTGNENNDAVKSALFFPSYNADGSLVDTDWNDHVYRTAVSHNHVVGVSGGSLTTNYYFSANYTNQEGFLKGNDFERKGVRMNINHQVNDWFKLGGTASYNTSENQSYNSGSLNGSSQYLHGAARLAFSLSPNVAAYNEDGSYNLNSTGQLGSGANLATSTLYNPLALFNSTSNSSNNDRFIGSLNAQLKLFKLLDFSTLYAIDRLRSENLSYLSPLLGSQGYGVGGSATNVSALRDNYTFTNTLGYNKEFGKHKVSALVGTDFQSFTTNVWGAYATKSSDPFFEHYQGGWTNVAASNNFRGERVYMSYFSRLNYDFDKRYSFTVNFRRDGNSALAKNKKYGNFGGVSGGWTLSQEAFFQNSALASIFDNVKVNASWGRVGNGNLTNDYGSFDLYAAGLYGGASTWALSQSGNSDLKWETSDQTNIGLSLGLLRNRLQIETAYFNNDVNNLILNTPQAPSKGIPGNSILTNVGSMYNRGVELGVNFDVIDSKDFSWNASFNFTAINNKVTALAGNNEDIVGYTHTTANANNVTRVGYSVGSLYGAKTDGVNPENGRRIFINADGDRVQYSAATTAGESNWTYLDGSPASAISVADYQVLGNALPKWYGGLTNNFRYKDFDLSLVFNYSGGNYIMNGTKGTLREQTLFNNHTDILKRWTTVGQNTNIPRLVYNDIISNGTAFPISENVEKADFLRLSNILFGYKIPQSLSHKCGIESLRVYAQATNLFLITGYSGTDPESSTNGNSNTTPGVERNSVGRGQTFTFGLNVTF